MTAPTRRAHSGCPIQIDGPYRTRNKMRPVLTMAAALLLLLVAVFVVVVLIQRVGRRQWTDFLASLVGVAAVTAPLALLALLLPAGPTALLGLWVAFTVGFMGARAVTLGLRARGEAWLATG